LIRDKVGASNSFKEYHPRVILQGVIAALPIVFGYIPIGIAFGVLAKKSGLPDAHTLLLSLIVYAGSSQFIAVSLLEANAPGFSIVLTTFVVNLRHLLMSASIAPYLQGWRKVELGAFAFHLTDETFALHSVRFPGGPLPKGEIFGTNVTAQVVWVMGSWIGITLGELIGEVEPLGLDYALPAMFVALVIVQLKDRIHASVALIAGLLSVGLMLLGLERWNVIIAALVAATMGSMVETWKKTSA
jgi:4-azaleucine resistance transporter AzlC